MKELSKKELKKVNGGFRLNLFGIYYIEGVLDGVKGNTRGHWSWEP
jgi:bacteriocin-like protein